jgi:hypothetical protein
MKLSDADVPRLKLSVHGKHVLGQPGETGTPFPLPRIQASHLNWMTGALQAYWRQHRRCLAFVLLYCPAQKRWVFQLPRQLCRGHETRFSVTSDDLPAFPSGYYVAGSYQKFVAKADGEIHRIPTFDGLHFSSTLGLDGQTFSLAIRCHDRVILGQSPSRWMVDDHDQLLALAREQFDLV